MPIRLFSQPPLNALLLFGLCLAAAQLCIPAPGRTADNERIYILREKGVLHLTDRPDPTRPFRLFAIVRTLPAEKRSRYIAMAEASGRRHGVDAKLVRAVMEVESNLEPDAVSGAGARGLMQIMPETQKELGLDDPFDPESNIEAGVRYLRMMYDRFGSWELALAAYNAGPAQVERYGAVPPFPETLRYVDEVMKRWR